MNWTFLITVISIIGVIANTYKKKWCFAIWICTNGFWCAYDFVHGLYSQSFLFSVYFVLAAWGLFKWWKDEKKEVHGVYTKITAEEASSIIDTRYPLGLFYLKDGKTYIGIDNKRGLAWTEEFKRLSACKRWLSN